MTRIITLLAVIAVIPLNGYGLSLLTDNPEAAKEEIQTIINDLKHDDVYFNAVYAMQRCFRALSGYKREKDSQERFLNRVQQHPNKEARERLRTKIPDHIDVYPHLIKQLTRALNSNDWQQRQMAARLLVFAEVKPWARLCEVLVEALHDDQMPVWKIEDKTYRTFVNAHFASIYMLRHPDCGNDNLIKALQSNDRQQRFLAAVLLAFRNDFDRLATIMKILLENLNDDNVPNNAKLAALAIYHLYDKAKPYLSQNQASLDNQGRLIIELIQREWAGNYDKKTLELVHQIGFTSYLKKLKELESSPFREIFLSVFISGERH